MKNKIFTFKVSIKIEDSLQISKKIYRVIEIKGADSLYNLAAIIVASFEFDLDHCFGFYSNIKSISRSEEKYELFADIADSDEYEGVKGVENTIISDVFSLKKIMGFLFDYGDDWFFSVKCIDISDSQPKTKYPKIIKSEGVAPKQYEDYG